MSADRRRRRSSISEHISRVFKSEKRASHGEFVPPIPFLGREAAQAQAEQNPTGHSLDDETPSSVSCSPINSRLPSTGTPGSSLSVAPGEDDTPKRSAVLPTKETEVQKASAREKPNKKEKRVTKRLEAERRELEKRLLALEDAQSKVDLGASERASRRLTKKQPVSNSSRSSSTNGDRPKSSSGLSSIFRRSRRNSASSDLDFQSAEFSRLQTDTNPPSLPLTLPERFGTAITRELQSKHGTALNLSAANKTLRPTQSRLLHATPKSDDLRENWKMAEAWKEQNGNNRNASVKGLQDGRPMLGSRKSEIPTNSASGDLDRELFSAALKHDRKSLPAVDHSLDRVGGNDRALRATSMPASQNLAQTFPPCPAKITIPAEISSAEPSVEPSAESPGNSSSSSIARIYHPLHLAQSNSTGNLARKGRVEPFPRTYKSSPLALNPADTNGSPTKDSRIPIPLASHDPNQPAQSQTPEPTPTPVQPTDDRGKSRLPVASSNNASQNSSRFKEEFNDASSHAEPPVIPVKSERRSQENWRTSTASTETLRDIPHSPFQASVRSPFHTGNTSPSARSHRTSRDMSDSTRSSQRSPPRKRPGSFVPSHSPHNSDNGHSDYDTADEEAPESPGLLREPLTLEPKQPAFVLKPTPEPKKRSIELKETLPKPKSASSEPKIPSPGPKKPSPEPKRTYPEQKKPSPETEAPISQPVPNIPEPRGPMSILKRRSQKAKPHQLTKTFVICCRCKYWHDLPSEVYARLACPERLDEPKLNSRKKNDRKSASRMSLQFPAAHAIEAMDLRPAPLLPRKVTCCWCGHNMSRSCCEGWTALVEMRERHH